MNRISKFAAVLAVLPVFAFSGSALADSPGQLEGGSNVYVVKNITQHGSYASTASALACGDEVQYSIELHNTEFGALTNIVVNASLPSAGGASTVTATTSAGGTTGTSGTVTVTIGSGQTISYEAGTTVLYNGSGVAIQTLADTITTSGVNVGTLNGSTTEFVNFKAKVNCPTPTPTPTPTPVTPAKPAVLPNTGPGDVIGLFGGVSAAGAAGHYMVSRRSRRNR